METNYISDLAIHPGEYLKEILEDIGMGQSELSNKTNRAVQDIDEVIKGKKDITSIVASELEDALGTPAHVWIGLQEEYDMACEATLKK